MHSLLLELLDSLILKLVDTISLRHVGPLLDLGRIATWLELGSYVVIVDIEWEFMII